MALRVAYRAVSRNKMRSALTMLGIFIGVAALITMVAVGQGANAKVTAQIESLGTNLLIILPGATTAGGVRAGFGSASTLTVADANAIKKEAPAVANVSYLIRQEGQVQYGDKNWTTSVQGVSPKDFSVRNISDITQAMEGSSRTMALLLATVASISLVVGGIGIMNILLVSVTERTHEIGIRMAIGARRSHVLLQFLVEAVLLSGIGGVAGIIMGVALSKIVSVVAAWPTLISPAAIAGGFIFSAVVGVFFGYYPARHASLLNPIDALRYE